LIQVTYSPTSIDTLNSRTRRNTMVGWSLPHRSPPTHPIHPTAVYSLLRNFELGGPGKFGGFHAHTMYAQAICKADDQRVVREAYDAGRRFASKYVRLGVWEIRCLPGPHVGRASHTQGRRPGRFRCSFSTEGRRDGLTYKEIWMKMHDGRLSLHLNSRAGPLPSHLSSKSREALSSYSTYDTHNTNMGRGGYDTSDAGQTMSGFVKYAVYAYHNATHNTNRALFCRLCLTVHRNDGSYLAHTHTQPSSCSHWTRPYSPRSTRSASGAGQYAINAHHNAQEVRSWSPLPCIL
jgi:hypothetical protein